MSAIKFWLINGTGNYAPEANVPTKFVGNIGPTGISEIDSSVIASMSAIGITGLRIENEQTPTFTVSSIGVGVGLTNSVVFGATYTGGLTGIRTFTYSNVLKPRFGYDGPIVGIVGNVSNSHTFSFSSLGGSTATFIAESIKQGQVYPFYIGTVYTVTSGEIIGFSEW